MAQLWRLELRLGGHVGDQRPFEQEPRALGVQPRDCAQSEIGPNLLGPWMDIFGVERRGARQRGFSKSTATGPVPTSRHAEGDCEHPGTASARGRRKRYCEPDV